MLGAHKDHLFSVEASQAKNGSVSTRIVAYDAAASATQDTEPRSKKQRAIAEAMMDSADEVRILATRWLLSSGFPYTVLQNNELLIMLRRLSIQPKLVAPARDTVCYFAEGELATFTKWVSRILESELTKALQLSFVAVLNDLWTNASKINVIGVTAYFIGSKWRLVKLSLLASTNTQCHPAGGDTTGSARNVCDYFTSTDQVDCFMHLLSLCFLYTLGINENTRNDGQLVVTPGGGFRDGLRVVEKLGNLASFFNSPLRLAKLKKIKVFYNLPPINIEVDSKMRVGYAVTLVRRSIFNYYAFKLYFDSAPPNGQTVWTDITKEDWTLIIKMESATDQLAQFSLGEVQKEGVASSCALLFRKMLCLAVEAESVNCLVLEWPDPRGGEFTPRRETKSVYQFSWRGALPRSITRAAHSPFSCRRSQRHRSAATGPAH
ncbi:unnamed protein product [Phytophthora fragariaefolia]|uniref:Unnamed protein product n=1 Tax=Phytophthora fragariaefolia TaxID=1490495 RepID=A0A9W6WZQ8_9STRA|nr:unnamed protein product [Phytophthora fragariaefolia]